MSSPPKKDINKLINQGIQEAQIKKEQYNDDPEVKQAMENVLALLATVKSTVQKRNDAFQTIKNLNLLASETVREPENFKIHGTKNRGIARLDPWMNSKNKKKFTYNHR